MILCISIKIYKIVHPCWANKYIFDSSKSGYFSPPVLTEPIYSNDYYYYYYNISLWKICAIFYVQYIEGKNSQKIQELLANCWMYKKNNDPHLKEIIFIMRATKNVFRTSECAFKSVIFIPYKTSIGRIPKFFH